MSYLRPVERQKHSNSGVPFFHRLTLGASGVTIRLRPDCFFIPVWSQKLSPNHRFWHSYQGGSTFVLCDYGNFPFHFTRFCSRDSCSEWYLHLEVMCRMYTGRKQPISLGSDSFGHQLSIIPSGHFSFLFFTILKNSSRSWESLLPESGLLQC